MCPRVFQKRHRGGRHTRILARSLGPFFLYALFPFFPIFNIFTRRLNEKMWKKGPKERGRGGPGNDIFRVYMRSHARSSSRGEADLFTLRGDRERERQSGSSDAEKEILFSVESARVTPFFLSPSVIVVIILRGPRTDSWFIAGIEKNGRISRDDVDAQARTQAYSGVLFFGDF